MEPNSKRRRSSNKPWSMEWHQLNIPKKRFLWTLRSVKLKRLIFQVWKSPLGDKEKRTVVKRCPREEFQSLLVTKRNLHKPNFRLSSHLQRWKLKLLISISLILSQRWILVTLIQELTSSKWTNSRLETNRPKYRPRRNSLGRCLSCILLL